MSGAVKSLPVMRTGRTERQMIVSSGYTNSDLGVWICNDLSLHTCLDGLLDGLVDY